MKTVVSCGIQSIPIHHEFPFQAMIDIGIMISGSQSQSFIQQIQSKATN
jgi:hypothetical protein